MLKTRRAVEFMRSLSIYSFLLFAASFAFLLFSSYHELVSGFQTVLVMTFMVLSWFNAILNIAIMATSLLLWFADRRFPGKAVFQALALFALTFCISFLSELIEHAVKRGIVIGL